MNVIAVKNLGKSYGNKQVLKNVNFDVQLQDFLAIVGYTGAGKSTLVKCLNLICDYEQGSIFYNGFDILNFNKNAQKKYLQEVSYIFQTPNLLQTKTVFENVKLSLIFSGFDKQKINQQVEKYLKFVKLADFKDKYPNELSGGQKQRVAIARSLVLEPKVLICDEITSALDPKTTHEIMAILKTLQQKNNLTIIFISHELDLIQKYANKTLILENGGVGAIGPTNEVFSNENTQLIKFYNKLVRSEHD